MNVIDLIFLIIEALLISIIIILYCIGKFGNITSL